MRIAIGPSDGNGERRVTVYGGGAREKKAEFWVTEYEQAEVALRPVQCGSIDSKSPPKDAGEVWAEIDVEEYRVVGQ